MKKAAFFILTAATLCCCKKSGKDHGVDNLVNKWEVRKSEGGIAGTVIYEPGNGYILEFKGDNTYAYTANGSIVQSGAYELQATSEQDKYRVTFHLNAQQQAQDITLKGDTLVVLSYARCCDMPDMTYVRVH